jgi:hypothetical protein
LLVIIGVLTISGVLSLMIPPKEDAPHPLRQGDVPEELPDVDHDGMLDVPPDEEESA